MYSRALVKPPFRLVKNGKPTFGSYKGAPALLDIKGVKDPFGKLPLPAAITRFGIRSRLSFTYNIGDYIGSVEFFDAKLFGFCEVIFWDKITNKKLSYRSFMGPRKRFVPIRLSSAICASFKKTRYIRISWDRKFNRLSLLFNVKGDSVRSSANAAFIARFNAPDTSEVTVVMPSPTKRRCSATWVASCSVHGALSLEATNNIPAKTMADTDGVAIVSLNRAYYKRRTGFTMISGMGNIGTRKITFRIITSTLDAADTNNCNPNTLFVDGKITPLPQVRITHFFGRDKPWVMQDTESMVDLEFKPLSRSERIMNALVITTAYNIIYGTFNGNILTAYGEKITLKDFPGIVKDSMMRF